LLDPFGIAPPQNVRAPKGDLATLKVLNNRDVNRGHRRVAFEAAWQSYVKEEEVRALLTEEAAE
jgi:hypothetical protein